MAVEPEKPQKKRPWVIKPFSRALIGALCALLVAAGILGTLAYNSSVTSHNSKQVATQSDQIAQMQKIVANQQKELDGINQILAIASGSTTTKAAQDSNRWVIGQLQELCQALNKRPNGLPGCQQVPLPPELQPYGSQPTTTNPSG